MSASKALLLGALLLFSPAPGFSGGNAVPAEQEQAVSLRFTKHAEQRMAERGVDREAVLALVATTAPFKYWHQGKWKTGYYDPEKRLFVAVDGEVVITVIADATRDYVRRLRAKKP